MIEVDVYPVGVLEALLIAYRLLQVKHYRSAAERLKGSANYLARQAKQGNWRAVRNSFNGYLAEPCTHSEGWIRAGHGWTKGRAMNDLQSHMRQLANA